MKCRQQWELSKTSTGPRHPSGAAPAPSPSHGAALVLAVFAALVIACAFSGVPGREDPGALAWVAAAVAGAWAVGGVVVAWRRPAEPLGVLMVAVGALGAIGLTADARFISDPSVGWETARALAVCLLPAVLLHLALSLPDGRLTTPRRRVFVVIGYLASIGAATTVRAADTGFATPLAVLSGLAIVVGIAGYVDRCRRAGAFDRARLQWAGWGVVVAAIVAAAIGRSTCC